MAVRPNCEAGLIVLPHPLPAWAGMTTVVDLARLAYGETAPNPLVAACVVRDQAIVSAGVHRRAGEAHAEPQAIAGLPPDVTADSAAGLVLYVNLEPCSHQGRTPPCVDAILASPIRRVVAAMRDPDPRVAGRGIGQLRAAGVQVTVGPGARAAAELNHLFIGRQLRRRPVVALKVALDAQGAVAHADGRPAAITGDAARVHAHWLRAGHDAILVGVETLRLDRPRLDRRLYPGPGRAPRRLVIDPQLRALPEFLWPGEEPRPVLFCTSAALAASGARWDRVAELVVLPEGPAGLDLAALPAALEQLGITSVLVEGGGITHTRFLAAGLWDRLYEYRAANVRLGGLAWSAAGAWADAARGLAAHAIATLGADTLTVWAHRASLPTDEQLGIESA